MSGDYHMFLSRKRLSVCMAGLAEDEIPPLNPLLKDWQQAIVRWGLRRGRAALFLDTGLGKTFQQLEWARVLWEKNHDAKILILTPLAVAHQTMREAMKFSIDAPVRVVREPADVAAGINITNYERIERFDGIEWEAVVPDESSIMKNYAGKIRNALIDMFASTPYRLACTATPAPNDFMELGNHSEFLGVMTRAEMLAMFFIHDGGETQKWRLKGHAENEFWKWLCEFAVMLSNPSDIGYDGAEYHLPPLRMIEHVVDVDHSRSTETLFRMEAQTLRERQMERRSTIIERCSLAADLANAEDGPFLAWCDLNDESAELAKRINGAVEVKGSDSPEHKENAMLGFSDGSIRCLVTKPSICGFGMNWQHCNRMAFVGLSDSYEKFKQAIARCWRFGQANPVDAHIIVAETEGAVMENIKRKARDAKAMQSAMVRHMSDISAAEIRGTSRSETQYEPLRRMELPLWIA